MAYKYILTIIGIVMTSVVSTAQIYVWQDNKIIFSLNTGIPDSITFEKPLEPLEKYSFSVGEDKRVHFSKGNLQYNDIYYEWRFAENQYDIIGDANSRISNMGEDDWIDLFGWGTFGYCYMLSNGTEECHYTCETSTDWRDYIIKGDWRNDLNADELSADWGVTNSRYIVNGNGDQWRTLSSDEWRYLFVGRAKADQKFGLATVNGQKGLIVLADEWDKTPQGVTFTAATSNGVVRKTGYYEDDGYLIDHFTDNVYTKEEWSKMEKAGALFLPAAGQRTGTRVQNLTGSQTFGRYYSTTPTSEEREGNVYSLSFYMSGVTPTSEFGRAWGASVRLVKDIE